MNSNISRETKIRMLMRAFGRKVTARELTNIIYGADKEQSSIFGELAYLEQRGIVKRTGTRAQYYFDLAEKADPHYFYVFQGRSFEEEYEGGFLWAPKKGTGEKLQHHWERLSEIKKGDVIFHGHKQYVVGISIVKADAYESNRPGNLTDDWARDGWHIDTQYYIFPRAVRPKDYADDILKLQPHTYGPFDKNGNGNMGYVYEMNRELAEYLLLAAGGMKDPALQNGRDNEGAVLGDAEAEPEALAALYPGLDSAVDTEAEEREDHKLVLALKQANVEHAEGFEYSGGPKEKTAPIFTGGHKIYPRDRQTAINALAHAGYLCEIDKEHPTFIRKNSGKTYTEPHHLIPMACSDRFAVSLDVEENIVSLCSNCHNQIHYGADADALIRKLYAERKDVLAGVGIPITLEELLAVYGY